MERVAFLVDGTGDRVDCLLNPETVQVTRLAGVSPRGVAAGQMIGAGAADDPLLFTGGGRTEMVLDLLFDIDFVDEATRPSDVRVLTRPLWMLSENSADEHGSVRPPLIRLVWGKTWNVPGVIVAIAERFDAFDMGGAPRRSWLRLKLRRVAESAAEAQAGFEAELAAASAGVTGTDGTAVVATGDGASEPGYSGVRFDLLSNDALGSPLRWRLLAEHNKIDNPLDVPPGSALSVPDDLAAAIASAAGAVTGDGAAGDAVGGGATISGATPGDTA